MTVMKITDAILIDPAEVFKIDAEKYVIKAPKKKKSKIQTAVDWALEGLAKVEAKPMGKITCKIPMTLDHFHDFYFLQALQASMGRKITALPELQFKKSVEKLQDDVQAAIDEIVPNIALRTFVYLFAACLGEARHANSSMAKRRWIPDTNRRARSEIYAMIAEFAPSKRNIDALVSIFDQEWTSGYGGQAWKKIAQALHMYYDAGPVAFLDHVIDLEHNGGTAFNKSDAKYAIQFRTEYNSGRFKDFLDYKFRYDMLDHSYHEKLLITPRVHRLIERYTTIFHGREVKWVAPRLAQLDDYVVQWGDKPINLEDKWGENVDVSNGNKPRARVLMNVVGLYEIYPAAHTLTELKAEVERKKQKAVNLAGKYMTDKLAKKITKIINKWMKFAKTNVKVPKAKVTYPALPCKVAWTAHGIKLCIPVKAPKSFGTPTTYGFELVTEGHMGIHPKAVKHTEPNYEEDGKLYEDGHLTLDYGKVTLHLETGNWNLSVKKLEALLD